jgi:hypothetical protein
VHGDGFEWKITTSIQLRDREKAEESPSTSISMSTEADYLRDLGKVLIATANRSEVVLESAEGLFEMGRHYAFHEVLSLMKQRADAFGLTDEQIGLEGVDIDSFLK